MQDIIKLDPKSAKKKSALLKTPIKPLDLSQTGSIAELVEAMSGMSVQARMVGQCAEVLKAMLSDKGRPTVFLGLAGPLIAGGLRKVIRDLIVNKVVDVIVSTGAILFQDIYQARGHQHYKGTPTADDGALRDLYIDRIYDTYVDEEMFIDTDLWLGRFADTLPPGPTSSRYYLEQVGLALKDEESIVATAARYGVPIFAPAINDSSIGIGLTDHYYRHRKAGTQPMIISSIQDNYELTQIVVQSEQTSAIYVAGGVPKNYINDSVVMSYIWGCEDKGHTYAIQVTTDSPHWGGLSGSTLKEATSWGKIQQTANTAMAFVEPTVSLPLLAGYVFQRGLAESRPD